MEGEILSLTFHVGTKTQGYCLGSAICFASLYLGEVCYYRICSSCSIGPFSVPVLYWCFIGSFIGSFRVDREVNLFNIGVLNFFLFCLLVWSGRPIFR